MNSLPKTVTRQLRGCDLTPGPTAPESSTLGYRATQVSNYLNFDGVVDDDETTQKKRA